MPLLILEGQREEIREMLTKAIDRPQIVNQIIIVGRDYFAHIGEHAQVIKGEGKHIAD